MFRVRNSNIEWDEPELYCPELLYAMSPFHALSIWIVRFRLTVFTVYRFGRQLYHIFGIWTFNFHPVELTTTT